MLSTHLLDLMDSLCDESKINKGFSIPYTRKNVALTYAALCCVLITLALVLSCLLLKVSILKAIIIIIACNLLALLSLMLASSKKHRKIYIFVTNLFLFSLPILL